MVVEVVGVTAGGDQVGGAPPGSSAPGVNGQRRGRGANSDGAGQARPRGGYN